MLGWKRNSKGRGAAYIGGTLGSSKGESTPKVVYQNQNQNKPTNTNNTHNFKRDQKDSIEGSELVYPL